MAPLFSLPRTMESEDTTNFSFWKAWYLGYDIRTLGLIFLISGFIDLFWILSYPEYSLKVFGTTFTGWLGAFVKYQHPVIHWVIGYGFWRTQPWAYYTYLLYLTVACLSEVTNQMIDGYHPIRTTMILLSLLFATYIVARRKVFHLS